jgi:hypothetical protein
MVATVPGHVTSWIVDDSDVIMGVSLPADRLGFILGNDDCRSVDRVALDSC